MTDITRNFWGPVSVVAPFLMESVYPYSVVEFRTYKEMMRAYKALNGVEINGKAIQLEIVSCLCLFEILRIFMKD